MFHRLAPLVFAVTLSGAASAAQAGVWREQSQKTFDAAGLTSIRIENARGVVTVRRGAPGRVQLAALKIVRATDPEQSERYSKGTQVVSDRSGDQLVIRVRYPQRQSVKVSFLDVFNGYEMPRVEVRLTVEVPAGLAAQLQSTSGDLVSEDLSGSQSLETTSGDVSIRGSGAGAALRAHTTSGDIDVADLAAADLETVSGDIDAAGLSGPLRASTTSGDISVKGAEDSLKITSVSGDIRVHAAPRGLIARSTSGGITIQEASGSVKLETSSGDIRVGLASPLAHADISTVSGDVSAGIEKSVGATLELRTTNGSIDVELPLAVKTVTRRLVSGVIGNGKAPVVLRSSSGDIHLSSGGNP